MNIVSCLSHLFIFLVGILLSIPFALLLIHILTLKTSPEHISQVTSLLFSSKQPKVDILTIPNSRTSLQTVWMFGLIITRAKLSSRAKPQLMFIKLFEQYLLVHLTSKRVKNVHHIARHRVPFSEAWIFDFTQAKVNLKLQEPVRTQYWSNKTPIVLSQLRVLVRYRLEHKSKTSLQKLSCQWSDDTDEIHLYTLTKRSKEEWFYRLDNARSTSEQVADYKTTRSSLSSTQSNHTDILTDQIVPIYRPPETNSPQIRQSKKRGAPTDSPQQVWPLSISTLFERIYPFPPYHVQHQNKDYLSLINHLISRCTVNFYEDPSVCRCLKERIRRKLKHLKLPSYIRWIRLSRFSFDNTYPRIENLKKIWFNENGLWTAVDFSFQGNISIAFTVKIDLIRRQKNAHQEQKQYTWLRSWLQRWFHSRDDTSVLGKITTTILTITINIRSINGVLLINIPSPPSDRMWFGFEDMPTMDFDVDHRQRSANQSTSSVNASRGLNKELNQLQTTINHLLSQWIKQQISKACVLPNMYDICMKWCRNPFEQDTLLHLEQSRVNHLLWWNENDFDEQIGRSSHFEQAKLSKKVYLVARWKQHGRLQQKITRHHRQRSFVLNLPKGVVLTDRFLVLEQR